MDADHEVFGACGPVGVTKDYNIYEILLYFWFL